MQSSIFALNCNTGEVEIIFTTWLRLSALRPEISKCKQTLWAKTPCWGQCPRCSRYGKPCCRWGMQKAMEWAWRNLCFLSFFFFKDHSFPGRDKLPDIPSTGVGRPSGHGGVIPAHCCSVLCWAMHISYTENGWYAENDLPLYFLKRKQKIHGPFKPPSFWGHSEWLWKGLIQRETEPKFLTLIRLSEIGFSESQIFLFNLKSSQIAGGTIFNTIWIILKYLNKKCEIFSIFFSLQFYLLIDCIINTNIYLRWKRF